METKATPSLITHFASIPDPRVMRTQLHSLEAILVVAICAIICSCEDWVSVAEFGRSKLPWLKTFLALPNGIPSHDTFSRVFSKIDPLAFSDCFTKWVHSIAETTNGDVVAIDGKTLRRSFDQATGSSAIHVVSAWSAANRLVLGQVKVEEKSNEIAAIPKLLQVLAIKGAIVTIDAMGCQKAIAEQIIKKDADFVIALKDNQPALAAEVKAYFEQVSATGRDASDEAITYHEKKSEGHGRIEIRRTWASSDLEWMNEKEKWPGLKSIVMSTSERTVKGKDTSFEARFYISSLKADAALAASAVQTHWQIENNVHWVLDVAFREDECRIRKGYGAENLSTLRRIALNLLKKEQSVKVGIKNRRLKAGWDEPYLLKVLGF